MPQLHGENPVTIPMLEPEIDSLTGKFHPNRLAVSGKMTALLARLLGGYRWTDPALVEIALTSDGNIFVVNEGDVRSTFLEGNVEDLKWNLRGVVDVVDVTHHERIRLAFLFMSNVTNHGADFDPFEFLGLK